MNTFFWISLSVAVVASFAIIAPCARAWRDHKGDIK